MSTKLVRTKEIVITSLLIIIIVSVSIINSINNQQVIAQQEQQASPEEIEGEILRGQRAISIGNDTTTTESSVQSLSNGSVIYESPVYGFRTQYPEGWDIIIQGTSNSSLSLRFNSPLENDTDNFRENIRLEVNNTSNTSNTSNTGALSNLTSATLASYLELYPGLKVIELSSTNLANNTIPAYKLVASLTQEGLGFMQIFAIKDDKAYTISYISQNSRYSTYLPMIEQIINSFEMM